MALIKPEQLRSGSYSITGSLYGTASFAPTSSLPLEGIVTASVSGNQITFTKGNNTQFSLQYDTGSFVNTGSFAVTSSNQFTGSQYVTGSVVATQEVQASIFMHPKVIDYDILVYNGYNALLISPVSISSSISIETTGDLVIV